jgi:excisionase family DNA binding protein
MCKPIQRNSTRFPVVRKYPEMSTLPQSDWLTAAESAAYLKVKPRTLLLWVRQRKVKAYALSGTKRRIWRFRKEDLDSALSASPVVPSRPLTVLSERGST